MKLTQLLERLEYEVVQGDDQIEVTELINDSRKVTEGSVFVCISGAVSDGHAYVQQVAEKGAAAVIVEKDVEAPEGLTVIKVENTRYALALTSAAYFGYPAEKLKVIGITGTKGKTTTTYMVKSILEEVGSKVGNATSLEIEVIHIHIETLAVVGIKVLLGILQQECGLSHTSCTLNANQTVAPVNFVH